MEELPYLTIVCKDRDENVFWDSAIFWKIVWKPDSVFVLQVFYRGKENIIIVFKSLRQEEILKITYADALLHLSQITTCNKSVA